MQRKSFRFLPYVLVPMVVVTAIFGAKDDYRVVQSMDVLFNVWKNVSAMYVDPIDPDKLLKDAADGMLKGLDPYTEFIPKSEVEEFNTMTTLKYGGVGSLISASRDSAGYVRIMTPYRGAPIDKAGVEPGSEIIEIDGKNMAGKSTEYVSNAMKGEPGTVLKITVRSPRTGKDNKLSITRERIALPAISYAGFITDSVGYIGLDSFSENCSDQVQRALEQMQATGKLKGLILDLRNNGGGIMGEAIDIVSLFVPKGSHVLSSKGRNADENMSFSTHAEPIAPDLPLVVMVNSSSASASEIVSGALQDMDRAVVVGARTFGKGLIQSPREVGFGNLIKVTTAKYYIPSGRCIQAVDYSHRNEDGSVGNIPDSLISEFETVGGRKVFDGGGITPDVKIEPRHHSKFPISLLAMGYIDDYSIEYFKTHTTAPDIRTFNLSDEDYEQFKEFVADKEITFKSTSEYHLDKLVASAKRELYYDQIKDDIERIEKLLSGDREVDLELYKDDIEDFLEVAIITRYHYPEGGAERMADSDIEVDRAIELLDNTKEYSEILSPQTTESK